MNCYVDKKKLAALDDPRMDVRPTVRDLLDCLTPAEEPASECKHGCPTPVGCIACASDPNPSPAEEWKCEHEWRVLNEVKGDVLLGSAPYHQTQECTKCGAYRETRSSHSMNTTTEKPQPDRVEVDNPLKMQWKQIKKLEEDLRIEKKYSTGVLHRLWEQNDKVDTLKAENKRMREALEKIAAYPLEKGPYQLLLVDIARAALNHNDD